MFNLIFIIVTKYLRVIATFSNMFILRYEKGLNSFLFIHKSLKNMTRSINFYKVGGNGMKCKMMQK